ncbi:type II secretion system protein G [compost metagenome]
MKIKQTGFTVVELIVVIVVIGILAAITVVAYNGIQNNGYDASVKSDLSALAKKLDIFYGDNYKFPSTTTDLESLKFKANQSAYDTNRVLNFSYCATADRSGYALGAISKSGKQFSITSSNGIQEYPSTQVNDGNPANLGTSCGDLLAGTSRIVAGFYSADTSTGPWRLWTKSG